MNTKLEQSFDYRFYYPRAWNSEKWISSNIKSINTMSLDLLRV